MTQVGQQERAGERKPGGGRAHVHQPGGPQEGGVGICKPGASEKEAGAHNLGGKPGRATNEQEPQDGWRVYTNQEGGGRTKPRASEKEAVCATRR